MIGNQQSILDGLNGAATESWRSFRIMAEMVNAFDTLDSISKPCISIFGSARLKENSRYYQDAEQIASMLVKKNFSVITGGGPGIMEAGNKGAFEAGGESIGLHIHLPFEQGCNQYVNMRCDFRYFFLRKFMFVKYSKAYIVMPGGMGTIDELSEAFVLAQTKRIRPFPIILYGRSFWNDFVSWMQNSMVTEGTISEEEIKKYCYICDTPKEVMDLLDKVLIV